jgi:medium-chain acyl-[acyl-carrier-protein] hydrolase
MNKDITRDFIVNYYEVDYYKKATPWSLLNYLQETAFHHADCAGDTQEVLANEQLTWMLYKWHVNIIRYPCWKDRITVKTWISRFKSYMAFREFEICNTEGEVLVKAGGIAILVDTDKSSPHKIDHKRIENYGTDPSRDGKHNYDNFHFNKDGANEQSFLVRISDIDPNGHVNNARYLDWFAESIPLDILQSYTLKELEIIYKRQIKYGHNITVYAVLGTRNTDNLEYYCEIMDNEGNTSALMRGKWVKRAMDSHNVY